MTCKDCVHAEICKKYSTMIFEDESLVELKMSNEEFDNCEHFKDRSRFVELPCKTGDTIYTVSLKYRILPWSVFGICLTIDGWSTTPKITLMARSTKLDRNAKFSAKMLNTSVFLTREEAEAALKEREENENV